MSTPQQQKPQQPQQQTPTMDFFQLFEQFIHQQQAVNTNLTKILATSASTHAPTANVQAGSGNNSGLSVQLPTFEGRVGENIISWLLQVDLVFQARRIEEADRLRYIVTSLKGPSLQWYLNSIQMHATGQPFASWND